MSAPERAPNPVFRSPSTLQVVALVAGLAWRRLANRFSHGLRKRSAVDKRWATPRKSQPGRWLFVFLAMIVLGQTISSSSRLVARFAHHAEVTAEASPLFVSEFTYHLVRGVAGDPAAAMTLDDSSLRTAFELEIGEAHGQAAQARRRIALQQAFEARGPAGFRLERADPELPWPSTSLWFPEQPSRMLVPLALVAALIGLVAFLQCLVVGGRDLADVGARAEWLFGFPVSARALFLAQALAVPANPIFSVLVWPFFAVVFWCAGYAGWGVPLGLFAAAYVGVLCGAGRILLETSVRRLLSPTNVARLQAVLYLLSSVVMMLTIALVYSPESGRIVELATRLPRIVLFSPFAVPVWLAAKGGTAWIAATSAIVIAVGALYLAMRGAEHTVRDGIVTATTTFQGQRRRGQTTLPSRVANMWQKELWAMLRDRQVRTQAFVAPGLLLLTQCIVNPELMRVVTATPQAVASAAFALSAFVLLGASTGLANESPTLGLLGALPVQLERLLLQKAMIWGVLSSVYACLGFAVFVAQRPQLFWPSLAYLPVVLLGIAIYSVIALGLGALGTDPHELEPNRRVGMGTIYQHLMLIGVFGVGLYLDGVWTKLIVLVLSALLAFAVWQKLKDRVPYLQDPTGAPPPQLSVTDGILAALLFFVLQGLFGLVLEPFVMASHLQLLLAFSFAGVLVAVFGLWQLYRAGVKDPLRVVGLKAPLQLGALLRALGAGVLVGCLGAGFAFGYLLGVEHIPWLRDALDFEPEAMPFDLASPRFLVVLAVLAAPVVEEFIFRGLLYGGFRRSLTPLPAALGSALVFALVHPSVAALPVFGLALGAAFVYERTRWLGAPIAAHMTYNALLALGAMLGAET